MSGSFGATLKEWRSVRRMSQLALSTSAEVSARHISFLESGRSRPSRDMVLHLAEVLDLPRAERNRLLVAAGFSPLWPEHEIDDAAMASVRSAISWTLERHDPYPALVLDRHWNVVDRNRAATALLDGLGATGSEDGEPLSFLDQMGDQGQLRALIDNWGEVGRFMLSRLRTESAAVGGDPILDAAIERLRHDPMIDSIGDRLPPVATIDLRVGDTCVSLFSTIAQFGTAEDLALAELRIELFFPADEPTRLLLESLA